MKSLLLLGLCASFVSAQHLPSTGAWDIAEGVDMSERMVQQLTSELEQQWRRPMKPLPQEELRPTLRRVLGMVDEVSHVPILRREQTASSFTPLRWEVMDGLVWEGLEKPATTELKGTLICLADSDCSWTQSEVLALCEQGWRVILPHVISRREMKHPLLRNTLSVPRREWIYRQCFSQGRHVIGYELQALTALLTALKQQEAELPVYALGHGEGGRLALYLAAVEPRLASAVVSAAYGPRSQPWKEPLDRNVWRGQPFSDATLARMAGPDKVQVVHDIFPSVAPVAEGKVGTPGAITPPSLAEVRAALPEGVSLASSMSAALVKLLSCTAPQPAASQLPGVEDERDLRLVRQISALAQAQLARGEKLREEQFWKALPKRLPEFSTWREQQLKRYREEVVGVLPVTVTAADPRSRRVRETEKVTLYELKLEAWKGVDAWAWVALPKDLKPGEQRAVIVCQHGLDGLPEHCYETDESTRAWAAYKAWALRLAERGYVTVAPHNAYRGGDSFRWLQRMAQPLGLSFFSLIAPQHEALLKWLKVQPWCAQERIAFYGLSYGGKSAMRLPVLLPDYCLSICSGDFNEWVRKLCSTDMRMSYVFTHEHEIWEWDLGSSFNYAELGALLAPRPFMVERGHYDGVGTDSWVNYEYAKVRQLYDELGLGQRTAIEHFVGPHTIHGVGTFQFLDQHLGGP